MLLLTIYLFSLDKCINDLNIIEYPTLINLFINNY